MPIPIPERRRSLPIRGFSSSAFIVDTSQFANSTTETFSVSVAGNNLLLNYFAPIPEPGGGLVLGGAVILLIFRRRPKVASQSWRQRPDSREISPRLADMEELASWSARENATSANVGRRGSKRT